MPFCPNRLWKRSRVLRRTPLALPHPICGNQPADVSDTCTRHLDAHTRIPARSQFSSPSRRSATAPSSSYPPPSTCAPSGEKIFHPAIPRRLSAPDRLAALQSAALSLSSTSFPAPTRPKARNVRCALPCLGLHERTGKGRGIPSHFVAPLETGINNTLAEADSRRDS